MLLAPEVVRPAHLWVPERRGSYLDEVSDVADLVGRPLDAEQRIAVDAKTSYGPDGDWLTLETLLKEPRQNGKTAGVETPIVLADLFLWGADRVAWTAHLFKTCREAFEDHERLISGTPEFSSRVLRVSYAHGEESIQLKSGARIDYLARSKGGGRGLGGKRVIIDEALFFASTAAGALLPILAARENPQIDYLSSAAKVESDLLRDLTARGRAGGDPSLILVEWCAPGSFAEPGCASSRRGHQRETPGCVLDDPAYQRAANPAVRAGRIRMSFLGSMRRTLVPVEFAREFLGWDEAADAAVDTIPLAAWGARVDETSSIAGSRALAFDITPDRGSSAIGGAGLRGDGAAHLALVEHRAGTSWLVPRLLELIERNDPVAIVVDGASPASSEIQALKDAGLRVRSEADPSGLLVILAASDMGRACAGLYDAVAGDAPDAWHRGDPILATALAGAARRDIGDGGWAFGRKRSDLDIAPIVTIAEALHGLRSQPKYEVWGFTE